jgi:acyl-CoA synthetase (AMP-forming)/AMP-acid ligase II
MNIVDPILFQCRRRPPVAAICVPGPGIGLISYGRLERFIHNISRRLLSAGLAPGQLVAVDIEDAIFQISVLLALARLGLAGISVHGSASTPVKVDAFISDGKIPARIADRLILADLSWTEGEGTPIENPRVSSGGADIFQVILTSGTTGNPKAVAVSHQLMTARIARHMTVFGSRFANCQRIYSDMPIGTPLGFQFLIYTLSRGGTYFLPGDSFKNTLQAIEEYKVQCVLAPPSGHELLLKWFEALPSYQSNIEVAICGGDILAAALSRRVRARICSHLIASYGSTEANITATAHAHEIQHVPGAVGYLTPGISAQIVDQDGTPLPPGSEGLLRVRSEVGSDSYLGDPAESDRVFRDGWFHPGDVARLEADGLLVITGREKTALSLGGDKVNPERIEAAMATFAGVAEVAVCGVPNAFGNNELVAVVVSGRPVDIEALKEHCRTHLGPQLIPSRFLMADRLPRNDMGKIDRKKLAASLRADARTS